MSMNKENEYFKLTRHKLLFFRFLFCLLSATTGRLGSGGGAATVSTVVPEDIGAAFDNEMTQVS